MAVHFRYNLLPILSQPPENVPHYCAALERCYPAPVRRCVPAVAPTEERETTRTSVPSLGRTTTPGEPRGSISPGTKSSVVRLLCLHEPQFENSKVGY